MRSLIPEPSFSLQKGPRQTRGDRAEQDGVNHGKRRLCVMRWCARGGKEEEKEKKEKEVYSNTAVVRLCRVVSGGEARTRNNTPASYSRWRFCAMTGGGQVVRGTLIGTIVDTFQDNDIPFVLVSILVPTRRRRKQTTTNWLFTCECVLLVI